MPQAGQIIPPYLQPYTMTVINDNTVFTETTAEVQDGVRSIFVFTSPKGRDGVLLTKGSSTSLTEEYGTPNFKLFGQPHLNAYAYLDSGITKGFCMRVMPNDANYANVVVVAKVKVDTTVPEQPKLVVHFETVEHDGLDDLGDVKAQTDLLTSTDPDVDGYSTYPLFAFYSQGRGLYGNNFRIRLTPSATADKDNDFRNYTIDVLELDEALTKKESFTGSTFVDALDGLTSLYMDDVFNDPDNGSQKIGVYVVSDSFTALYNLYKTNNPTTEITEDQFDVIAGKLKDNTVIPNYSIDTTNAEFVALDAPDGVSLSAGTDGAFAADAVDQAARQTAIDNAYVAAFNGTTDPSILSKRSHPAEVILDAGYSAEVKTALISLLTKRYDAEGYIDAGILNTKTDALAWGESMSAIGDRIFSKQFQNYKIHDPFTGKAIQVTVTYYLARMLANHIKNVGNQNPFTGKDFAQLTGYIKGSLQPVVDADDLDFKEQLYNYRMNYFETIAENTHVRGTQTTSQNIWSDLSEEHNMLVLLEMKRALENMVSTTTYKFAEVADRKRYEADAKELLTPFIGTKVRSATVQFGMSKWEETRSILHSYLAVVFNTISKRNIVEIDINPRA